MRSLFPYINFNPIIASFSNLNLNLNPHDYLITYGFFSIAEFAAARFYGRNSLELWPDLRLWEIEFRLSEALALLWHHP